MKKQKSSSHIAMLLAAGILLLQGCSPEVGSDEWCKQLEEKPKADWSANDAADYAKHCILK